MIGRASIASGGDSVVRIMGFNFNMVLLLAHTSRSWLGHHSLRLTGSCACCGVPVDAEKIPVDTGTRSSLQTLKTCLPAGPTSWNGTSCLFPRDPTPARDPLPTDQ
ncbi:Retinol dehydrogenase 11 [Fusarium oxysporum f. sp. albedinis]|nr:Retinol dehydrogenase 11 [Fusarium oxysporum f. sp. albedinis]